MTPLSIPSRTAEYFSAIKKSVRLTLPRRWHLNTRHVKEARHRGGRAARACGTSRTGKGRDRGRWRAVGAGGVGNRQELPRASWASLQGDNRVLELGGGEARQERKLCSTELFILKCSFCQVTFSSLENVAPS